MKIKMRIFCLIIGLHFLSFFLYAGDLGSVDGHAVVFEKGDAIYRKGKTFPTNKEGHAGIFYEWPITEADTHDSSQYSTIEALGIGLAVSKSDISTFLDDGAAFWGVHTANLTRLQRAIIVGTAKNQMGIPFRPVRGYKNPGISFRCDGLVEYCYEMAGVDLVPGDTWSPIVAAFPGRNFITPKRQMNSPLLSERTSASVETVELARVLQNGEAIEPEEYDIYYVYNIPDHQDTVTIEVNVSDGENGSGIRMTDFWVGEPDDTPDTFEGNNSGKRIEIDDHPETVGGICKADWDIDEKNQSSNPLFPPGEYTIHILVYDQAGNMKNVSIELWKRDVIVPPPSISLGWEGQFRYGRCGCAYYIKDAFDVTFVFNACTSAWNNNSWIGDYQLAPGGPCIGLNPKAYFGMEACPYFYGNPGIGVVRAFPKCNLTSYNPNEYFAEIWFQVIAGDIFGLPQDWDAHNSGYEENMWYKYPEDPVVGTNWQGSIIIPEVNNPPNWNQHFLNENITEQGFYVAGWEIGSLKVYLFPK